MMVSLLFICDQADVIFDGNTTRQHAQLADVHYLLVAQQSGLLLKNKKMSPDVEFGHFSCIEAD